VRHDAGDVGVDDEDSAKSDPCQACLHRRSLAPARVGDDLGSGVAGRLRRLLVRCHDARASHREARREDVAEHRVRERPADATRGVEARLPLRARERDHHGRHEETLDTPAVTIAATQTFPGPAWDELAGRDGARVVASPGTASRASTFSWRPSFPSGLDELRLLPDLRLVGNYGVGYDNVDCRRLR
jgi:hypothetical protein